MLNSVYAKKRNANARIRNTKKTKAEKTKAMMNRMIKLGKISTSKIELIDILKAWLIISFTFTFLFTGLNLMEESLTFDVLETASFWILFVVSLFTVGIGFLLHEMAHKISAQRYGCIAEFRAFDNMLFLALGLAVVIGFTFIAPGAVMISGTITRKENGIISAAGPITNYALAILFFMLGLIFPAAKFIFDIGFQVNLWLGLFNMIPLFNFDGAKILNWNRYVWGGMVAFGIFFLFILPFLL
jgi:Zn-dependent protease